jgi:hypothetical protein
MPNGNRRFLLKTRPTGIAGPEHFTEEAAPVRTPDTGEVFLETMYLSVDPAMRVWISETPGYGVPVEIGEVMHGGGIARVIESRADNFASGDLVRGSLGWQSHPTLPAAKLEKLDPDLGNPLDWLGLLGLTGVGQVAAQIGKIEACRVGGIAGGAEKCRRLTTELGLDAAIDYRAEADLPAAIARACPGGVDVFFDNVGGPTLEAAIANLRVGARVVICGRISQTAGGELYGVRNLGLLIGKRARIQGFGVFEFADRYPEARTWLAAQAKSGCLRQRVHVIDGLEQAPVGLGMLFRGENQGKLVVRVAE